MGTQKQDEILNSTKASWDKRGLQFEYGSSTPIGLTPKFIKLVIVDPKLKFITTAL